MAEKRKRSPTPSRSPTRRKSSETSTVTLSNEQDSEDKENSSDISVSASTPPTLTSTQQTKNSATPADQSDCASITLSSEKFNDSPEDKRNTVTEQTAAQSRQGSTAIPTSSQTATTAICTTSTTAAPIQRRDTSKVEEERIGLAALKTGTTTVPSNTPQEHLKIPTGATAFSGFPALNSMSSLMVPSAAAAAVVAAPFLTWSPMLLPPWSHALLPAAFYPAALRTALPG